MTEQDEWIPLSKVDWDDPQNNVFSIDTRDFHVGYRLEGNHKDYSTIKKYPDFFHTKEEIISLLDRYKKESGGEGDWRLFSLEGDGGWSMKYIRIWRSELGFIVCDRDNKALRKDFLSRKVIKDY